MNKNLNRSNVWLDFWKTENITRDIIRQCNMKMFVESTENILNYEKDDIVMDIGSGPGTIVHFLKDRVKEIHCLDISDKYLDMCRKNFQMGNQVFPHKLDESNYTDLSFLKEKKFSKIICLSVIQYYQNLHEVEKLITEVKNLAQDGAKMLIADIPVNDDKLSDIWGILSIALKNGFLWEAVWYLIRHKFSDYYSIRKEAGILIYPEHLLKDIINRLQLNAEILDIHMTTNIRRKHLLINFV
jgi:cyclopropane fatty-acyl-phospholipid synthase-like methyltransferase